MYNLTVARVTGSQTSRPFLKIFVSRPPVFVGDKRAKKLNLRFEGVVFHAWGLGLRLPGTVVSGIISTPAVPTGKQFC